jgi:hypothetical protein
MGAVFALYSAWYFWIPKILGVDYNKSQGKVHFWILFVGVNVTFFPQHFLGLQGMPRRISDYADAFAGWNMVSSVGSIVSVIATLLFLHVLYAQLTEGKVTHRYPWLTPQYYYDLLQAELNRSSNSLEWGLDSPPKPHAFVSLPVQSTLKESISFFVQKRLNFLSGLKNITLSKIFAGVIAALLVVFVRYIIYGGITTNPLDLTQAIWLGILGCISRLFLLEIAIPIFNTNGINYTISDIIHFIRILFTGKEGDNGILMGNDVDSKGIINKDTKFTTKINPHDTILTSSMNSGTGNNNGGSNNTTSGSGSSSSSLPTNLAQLVPFINHMREELNGEVSHLERLTENWKNYMNEKDIDLFTPSELASRYPEGTPLPTQGTVLVIPEGVPDEQSIRDTVKTKMDEYKSHNNKITSRLAVLKAIETMATNNDSTFQTQATRIQAEVKALGTSWKLDPQQG